jgi:predicted lactoylglutathione lyase
MSIGAFSLSLTVKDIQVSLDFYQKLGFTIFFGEVENKYIILKNGDMTLGLFEGMFEKNMITFNPGWTDEATDKDPFTDVRALQKDYADKGLKLTMTVESEEGPGSLMLEDPDGNPILIDQHR